MNGKSARGRMIENDLIVQMLRRAVKDGGIGMNEVPGVLKKVLREGTWKSRVIEQSGRSAEFESFEEFVTAPPLLGMGTTLELLRRICADDPEALDLLDRATERRRGGDRRSRESRIKEYNVPFDPAPLEKGNSKSAALRRLRTSRPDLHARVLAGEISAHGAMVLAGYRTKTVSIPLEPQQAAKSLFDAAAKNGIPWSAFQDAVNLLITKPAPKPNGKKSAKQISATTKKSSDKPKAKKRSK